MDPAIATPGNAALALRHGDNVFFTATEVADGKHSAVLRAGDPSHPDVGATLTLGVQANDALRISQTDVLFRTTAHMQSNLIVRDSLVVQNGAISATKFDNLVDDFITNSLILPPTANALATAYVTLSNLIVSRVAAAYTGGANNESYYGSRIPTGSETMQMGSIACADVVAGSLMAYTYCNLPVDFRCAYMDQPPSAYALNMAYVQLSNYVQTKLATLNTTLSVMEGYGGNTSTSNNSIQLPSDGMWQTDMWLQSADGTDRMLFHTGGGTEFPSQRYTWRAQEVGASFLDIEPGVGMTLHEGTLFVPSVDVAGPLSVAGSLVVSGPNVDFRQVESLRIPTGNVEAGTVFANHYCNLPPASSVQRGVVQIAASRNQLLDAYSSNVAVSASLFAAVNSNIDSRVTNATVLVTEALYAATELYQRSINDTQRIVRDYYTNEPVECIKMTSHASNAGDVMSLMLINDTDESVKLDIYPDAAGSEASLVATKGLMIRGSTAAEIDIGSVVRVRTGPDAARIIPEGPEFALTPGFEATSSSTYAPDSWSAPYQAFSDTPLATSWISKLGSYTSDSGAPTRESALTNTLSLVGDAPISVHGEWVQLNFPSVLYVHSVFIACSSMGCRHMSSQHAFIIDNGDFMAGPLVMPDAHRDTVLIRDSNTYVTIGGRLSFVNNYGSNVDLDSASNLDLDSASNLDLESASNLDSVNREDSNALLVLDWNTVSSPCGHGMLGTPEVPWASIAGRDQLYLQDGRLLGAAISDLTWNDASLPMVDRNHGLPWADVHAGHRCHHIGSSSTRLVKNEASRLFNLHLPGEVTLAIGGADAVLGYSLSSSSSRHVVVDILVSASGAIRVAVLLGVIWTWEEDPRTEAAVTLWRVQLADKSPYVESIEAVLEVVVADDGGGSIIEGSEGGGIWETDPDHLVLMFNTRGGYYGEGQVRWKKTGAAHPFTLIPPANTSLHTSVVLSISFDEVSWGRALGTASAAYMDLWVACSSDLFALSIQASGSVWVRDCVNASALVVDDVSLSGDGGVVWAVLPSGASDIFSTHFEMVTFDQSLSSSVVALPASGENVVVASQSSPRTPGNALMFRGMCNAVLGTYSEVRLASSLLLSIRGDSSFPGLVWLAGSDQLEVPENAVAVIGCDNNSSTCTSAWMNVVSLHNCSLDRAIMAAGIADSGLFMLMVSIKDIVDPRAVRIGCSSSSYSGNRSFSIEHLCSGTGGGGVLALQLPGHSSSLKLPGAAMEALGGVYLSGNRQVFSPSVGGAGLVLAAPDADVGIVASGDVHLRSTLGRVQISSDIVAERDCRVLGKSCFLGPSSFEAPSAFNEELVVDGDLFVNWSMSVRGSVFLDGPVSMAPLGPPVRLSDNALTEVGQIVFRDDGRGFSLVGGTYADEEDPRLLFEGLSHPDTAQRYYGRAQMGEVGGGQSLVDAAWMYADGMETRDRTVGTFLRLSESIKLHAGQKLRASVDASGGVLVLANDGDSCFPLTVSGDAPSDLVQAAFGSSISRPPVAPLPSYTGMRLESGGGDLVILGGEGGGVMQVSDVGVALDLNPAGGLVRVNGVPIQSTSDGRQKTNRSDLLGTSSADILRRLRPCTYTHRGVVEAGFIAQEVFCEVPEMRHLISLPRDFEIDDDNTLGNAPVGLVGLNYVGIIAYLVSAMQEQSKKIEDLQARISHGVVVPGLTSNVVNAPYPPLSGIRAQSGTSGLPTISFSNAPDTGLFNPSVGTLGVVAGGAELVRVSNTVSVMGDLVVSSNIIPSAHATQYIGSSTMHFKEAWIDTLHISSNTLYIGDTPVLGTDDQTVSIRADPGQGISITTTGVGETSLVSESGVNVVAGGGVNMQVTGLNKVVDIQSSGAGGTVQLGATKEVVITTPLTPVSNNLTVSGNLTVNGSNFTVNTQTVTVEDNIIVLNSGEIGLGVTKGEAGITIDRGDAMDYQLLFRESDDKFVMGPQGSLVPIATETFAANAGNISTGVLGVTMGGTGVSASTGTGSNVLSDNATMSNLNIVGGIYQNGVPFKVGVGFDDGTVGFPSITFNSDSNTGLYRLGADTIGISTGGVPRVTILDNGNVGFGTNAPEARLHVVGDGYFNGNVIATSNIIGFSTMESDSNVKHHFLPITDALDKIDAIGAYTFEYRGDDSRKRHAGVIAQQVQQVLPEVVDVHPLKDTLTVAYGNLSSLLLAGVQELRDELNTLKEELKEIRYLRGFYSEVVFVSSDVDGREYLLRRLPDRQNAANLMARINSNLNKLVQHLVAKYPKNPVVRQLYDNYNPDALSEGGAELGYTSYSVNKGEKIVLCLRQRDHELVEENILMYVAIHELVHLATDEVGHTPKFWSNFKWILGGDVYRALHQGRL
eukprot:gene12895-biopygen12850